MSKTERTDRKDLGVKAIRVVVVIRANGAVTLKLKAWLQEKLGTTSQFSVQKRALLGTAEILRRTFKLPGLC